MTLRIIIDMGKNRHEDTVKWLRGRAAKDCDLAEKRDRRWPLPRRSGSPVASRTGAPDRGTTNEERSR